jgi:hypothetical protein
MFVKKSVEEIALLSDEAFKLYQVELSASEEIKAAKLVSDIEAVSKKNEELGEIVKTQGLEMAKMKDKTLDGAVNTVKSWINDNAETIQKLKTEGHGSIELKVVGAMTTGSATNPDGIPELVGVQVAPPTNVNLRGVVFEPLVTKVNTSLAAYPYTESVPKDGDYAFVAEGGTKPQIDFKIETRYAQPVKVAAHEVLTDESVTDIPNLQSIAEGYLRAKHDLKKQNGIFFGDGISPNPKGATVFGRTFVAGDMATAVASPNFMDVVNACITDIFTTHNYQDEMPYLANLAMVNPVDFYLNLVSAKDSQGHPLYPEAALFNRVTIGGVTIIPFEDIPSGKIFVADMSKYNVTNYVDYTIRIGWINDQLITNEFTMVGESRFHAFVKKLDEQAFIYDDIATIQAAITAV